MKILIADFEIAKYGGIVEHVAAKVKALKALGHEVDIVQLSPSQTTQKFYDKKIAEFKSGAFQNKIKINSQGWIPYRFPHRFHASACRPWYQAVRSREESKT